MDHLPAAAKPSGLGPRLARLFRRVTTSGAYVPEIDGLRFVAIAAVVALHTWGYWVHQAGRTYPAMSLADRGLERLIAIGYYGVHLFFMISGFVLAVPFCKHVFASGPRVDLRKYFWRRLTRLEPPYIVSMVAFFIAMPLAGKGTYAELWPHLLASLAYVHNAVYGAGSVINNNAWSLEIEVQFYVLMPLIAFVLLLPRLLRRTSLALVAIVLSLHTIWLPHTAPKSILQFGQYFLLGILLCDLWTTAWRHASRTAAADLPGLAAWPLFIYTNLAHSGVLADAMNPWIMGLLFYSALRGEWHSRLLSFGPIPTIGGMCYSIYLLHARIIAAVIHGGLAKMQLTDTFAVDYPIVLVICSAAVVALSSVFFLLVEKPCMDPDWPQKLSGWFLSTLPNGLSVEKNAGRTEAMLMNRSRRS